MTRPRGKSHKGGKWKKSYKHPQKKQKLDANVVKRRKNVKSIQRAKEMVEMHRKQKNVEDKYRLQNRQNNVALELGFDEFAGDRDDVEEEEDAYEALVSELLVQNGEKLNQTSVESSEESEEDMEEDDLMVTDEENSEEQGEDLETDDAQTSEEDEVELTKSFGSKSDGEMENRKTSFAANTVVVDDDDNDEENMSEMSSEEDNESLASEAVHQSSKPKSLLVDKTSYLIMQKSNDTFSLHLDYEIPAEEVEKLLTANTPQKRMSLHWSGIGNFTFELPLIERPAAQQKQIEQLYRVEKERNPAPSLLSSVKDLQQLNVKSTLAANTPMPLNRLQSELFALLNQYQDLFYPARTLGNASEIRLSYCLHTLNHMLKTRSRILHHNAKLTAVTQQAGKKKKNAQLDALIPDSYRDQGLMRPKVLMIVPFRETAYHIVNTMAQLLHGSNCIENGKAKGNTIMNYERFVSEYTGQTLHFSKTNPKPEDYEQTFSGNTDDNFRIGISLTKKCLKLYTDFYASDILLASPLGLRLIIGAPGSAERDYDFLNSIELLIIDQAELLYAQNWENLLHVIEHLHLQPQSLRDTDFQRVRPWCLSGLSRFYRQTILFSSHELPEFRALFSSKCCNYEGRVRITNPINTGSIRSVAVPLAQMFKRIDVSNLDAVFDQRFQHFIREVLPQFRDTSHAHCMIYVPSYFDYVRLRNYLKAETISFVQICEYTNKAKMARARDLFFHSGAHFMLYSERSHFYRRTRVKGIRHLIMYQPPVWPHFYSEMINLMHTANQNARDGLEDSMSVTVLYTKYDLLQLKAILGSEQAAKLVQSGQKVHTFASE